MGISKTGSKEPIIEVAQSKDYKKIIKIANEEKAVYENREKKEKEENKK